MNKAYPLLIAAILLQAGILPSIAANLDQEYIQVRKIALKDPKVQEAFDKANARLDERILEIDPALKPIVDHEHGKSIEPRKTAVERRSAASASAAFHQDERVALNEHIVVKGDTLSSIAGHYKVTVDALQTANHITAARRLRVGQKLMIPAARKPEPRQSGNATPHQEAKSGETGGWWSDLKKNL